MVAMSPGASVPMTRNPLGDPEIRKFLEEFVRRRVPPADVDDVVQTILCDALAAERAPTEREELRRWLVGIARHKVADLHRKGTRERPVEAPEPEAPPAPVEVREMARWAEEQAQSTKDGGKTLAWMAREGEGEKLETIAEEENLPPARVRQRVSRMRRWMKERWAAELAAVAMLALLAIAVWRWLRADETPEALPEVPVPTSQPDVAPALERARVVRADALRKCEAFEWQACLDGLDEAKRLDPAGDTAPEVGAARARAERALQPPPQAPDSKEDAKAEPLPKKSEAPIPSNVAPKPKAPQKSDKERTLQEMESKAKEAEAQELQKLVESPPPPQKAPEQKSTKAPTKSAKPQGKGTGVTGFDSESGGAGKK
jgi:DNA-directed RNA polymerase specialized sigma24 family protein